MEEKPRAKKGKKGVVYASWSEGARRMDEEMQKKQETSDERRLASIVSGLGCYETGEGEWDERPENFVKGARCLEMLKELQRCLNRENPDNRRVYLQLGQWNVVGKYVVPIILGCSGDEDAHLFVTSLKVAILLTMPVEVNSTNTFDQVEYLCQFKDEFCERNVIGAIVAHLEEPLENMERGSVTEDDWRLLQLVLALMQNLLAVPEAMNWVGPYPADRYSQLRDKILQLLFHESIPEVVLAIVRHLPALPSGIRRDNILILQILHHMYWGQQPEALVQAAEKKGSPTDARQAFHKVDRRGKGVHRHSHFTGSFIRVDQDGSKTMLLSNPFQTKEDKMQKHFQAGDRKEKSFPRDIVVPLPSGEDVSLLLKEYADEFLTTGGYNILMQTIKDDIRRERKEIETADIAMFFRVSEFFLGYQHYHFTKNLSSGENGLSIISQICGQVSCTMDDEMFKLVVSKWLEYAESPKVPTFCLAVVSAGALLKEMMSILDAVLKNPSEDAGDRDVRMARTLSYKLFYDQTESGIFNVASKSMKAFKSYKQPRSHLQTMVELTHVALKLTETVTREDGALRVSRKSRKRMKREQVKRVDAGETHTPDPEATCNQEEQENLKEMGAQSENADDEEDECTNLESCHESTLNVQSCVEKFADGAVISNYCWLLSFYETNTLVLNHYILCMLHRICKDCDLEPMLYQMSTFEIFHNIVSDKKIANLEEFRILISFVTKVIRNFFKKLESCPLLYVDVLFAKSRKLCREISLDYTIVKLRGGTKGSVARSTRLADALGEDEGGAFGQISADSPSLMPNTHEDTDGMTTITAASKKRSRRGPFSDQDDSRIRELFQQLKENRSCIRLIAEALNSDRSTAISAAQVSRKLKQLGLHRDTGTRKRVSKPSSSDESVDREVSSDDAENSNADEEASISPRRRKLIKNADNAEDLRLASRSAEVSLTEKKEAPPKKRKLVKRRDCEENNEIRRLEGEDQRDTDQQKHELDTFDDDTTAVSTLHCGSRDARETESGDGGDGGMLNGDSQVTRRAFTLSDDDE